MENEIGLKMARRDHWKIISDRQEKITGELLSILLPLTDPPGTAFANPLV
jgi:hypothetical protein